MSQRSNIATNYTPSSERSKILLIIPCYNESGNIGPLLNKISKIDFAVDTIVIDDGSRDETATIASQASKCVRLIDNLGIGGAVQTGIKYALRNGYDFAVQVDGDGQHPPDQIVPLLEEYNRNPRNIIIGSRFLKKEGFQSSLSRRSGIAIISTVLKLLYGKIVTDPTSGLRLMDRKALRLFSEFYPTDYPEPISLAAALQSGLTFSEIPVLMKSREAGRSSIYGLKTLRYMIRVVGYIVLMKFTQKRLTQKVS